MQIKIDDLSPERMANNGKRMRSEEKKKVGSNNDDAIDIDAHWMWRWMPNDG